MRGHIVKLTLIVVVLFISGCNAQAPLSPATQTTVAPSPTYTHPTPTALPKPTATPKITPTFTVESKPTIIKSPTATPMPTEAPSCSRDQVLVKLKEHFLYNEFAVFYNSVGGDDFLNIWFVDGSINPEAEDADIAQNAILARRDAAILVQRLNRENTCIEALFDVINPIVVDSNFNGWFSGNVKPADLPRTDNPTDAQFNVIQDNFEISYWRSKPPAPYQPAPSDSCTWVEALEKIKQHFDTERENVSFYLILDETGTTVYANWDSDVSRFETKLWFALQLASTMNVAMELHCLYPAPMELTVIVVDSNGKIELIGTLPEPNRNLPDIDMNEFNIIYQDIPKE